uniref:Fibroblast activation protein, alpha n=1 Tax=Scophthalmus maximus TaxID=52904 RepID=A0A8D3DNH6_SCOMX
MGCSKVLWGAVGAAVVITIITIPAVYYSKHDGNKRPYSFEDYFNDSIRWRSYDLYWISDAEYLHKTGDGNVFLHNAETKEQSIYLKRLHVCHCRTFVTPVTLPTVVQYFTWAPTGHTYVTDVGAEAVQVTHNGKKNEILNGVPDWVYEEEVFASNGAIWWSSTAKFLAYLEFNDTEVHKVEFSWFGSEQYPQTVSVPYPKAGSSITKVKLFVVDTSNLSRRTQVVAPASVSSGDHILCSVTWVTDERVAVQWLTRKQNHVVVQIYDFDGSSWREKQVTVTSLTGWVGHYVPLPLFFAEDNLSFYKVMSDPQGYKHIHYVKNVTTPITSGKWEVIYISKLTRDAIYFVSNEYQGDGREQMYKILQQHTSAPQCLTCDLFPDRCQYNSAYFSSDASYYRMDCYGQLHPPPRVPPALLSNDSSMVNVWELICEISILEDNKDLENILTEFQMPKMQYGTLRVAGFDMWYQLMLPPNFKKSKKYPLLIDVYGGPCSQKVNYRFKLNWGAHLSSTHGIIIASFDGRGSGYQGDEIMHAIYKRLGTFEVEDQITAVRKFIDMGFIDKDRIAIWGWSYGGYVTSMALGAGTGLFKCGIAVAPVAKWEYYDAVYTERYMGMPTDNSDAYTNSTVTARARNFKTVDYLLVHGTADDNVHFQQAAQISKALVDEQVDFETMWYTDKDHALGGSAYRHAYNLMSHFLQKCLHNPK